MSDFFIYLLVVAAVLGLRFFVLSFARVKGSSMLSTLHNGDWLLVWRLGYLLHPPQRQDVVICHYPQRYWKNLKFLPMSFVKRVVALPKETVELIDGVPHIDGRPLHEPYLDAAHTRFQRSRPPREIPEGHCYVLGDNRDNSNDSRSVGPIRRRAVRGRAVMILWPPRHFGKIR